MKRWIHYFFSFFFLLLLVGFGSVLFDGNELVSDSGSVLGAVQQKTSERHRKKNVRFDNIQFCYLKKNNNPLEIRRDPTHLIGISVEGEGKRIRP